MDALGNPIGFHLTEGQACELDGADVLLPQLEAKTVIADGRQLKLPERVLDARQITDKGFDADKRVLNPLKEAGKQAVIPPAACSPTRHAREYLESILRATPDPGPSSRSVVWEGSRVQSVGQGKDQSERQ